VALERIIKKKAKCW